MNFSLKKKPGKQLLTKHWNDFRKGKTRSQRHLIWRLIGCITQAVMENMRKNWAILVNILIPAGSSQPCIGAGYGRCASMPASDLLKKPINDSAICLIRDRRVCRSLLICRHKLDMIPTMSWLRGKSAKLGLRLIHYMIWNNCLIRYHLTKSVHP